MPRLHEIPEMLHVCGKDLATMQSDESLSQTGIGPQGRSSNTLEARSRRCLAVTTIHLRRFEGVEDHSAEPVAVVIGRT